MQSQAAHKVRSVRFGADDPTQYAGQTRWIAAKTTATGRASVWCRHYHESEAQAHDCGATALNNDQPLQP